MVQVFLVIMETINMLNQVTDIQEDTFLSDVRALTQGPSSNLKKRKTNDTKFQIILKLVTIGLGRQPTRILSKNQTPKTIPLENTLKQKLTKLLQTIKTNFVSFYLYSETIYNKTF